AYYLSKEQLNKTVEFTIKLAEEVSFLNRAAIKKTLKNVNPGSKVTIDARSTSYITTVVLEMIQDFANVRAKEENIHVEFLGFKTSDRDYEVDEESHILISHRRAM